MAAQGRRIVDTALERLSRGATAPSVPRQPRPALVLGLCVDVADGCLEAFVRSRCYRLASATPPCPGWACQPRHLHMAAALHPRSVSPLARSRLRDACDAAVTLFVARRCGLHRLLWRGQERDGDALAAVATRCTRQHACTEAAASTEKQSPERTRTFKELRRRWREQTPAHQQQKPSLMPSEDLRRQWDNHAKRVQYWTDGDAREEKKRRQRRRYGQDAAVRAAQQQRARAQQAAWRDWVHADMGTHAAYKQAWKEYYATRRRGRRSVQRQQATRSHHGLPVEGQSSV